MGEFKDQMNDTIKDIIIAKRIALTYLLPHYLQESRGDIFWMHITGYPGDAIEVDVIENRIEIILRP